MTSLGAGIEAKLSARHGRSPADVRCRKIHRGEHTLIDDFGCSVDQILPKARAFEINAMQDAVFSAKYVLRCPCLNFVTIISAGVLHINVFGNLFHDI